VNYYYDWKIGKLCRSNVSLKYRTYLEILFVQPLKRQFRNSKKVSYYLYILKNRYLYMCNKP